jgi:hypothetical protein
MHFTEWLAERDPELLESLRQEEGMMQYLANSPLGKYLALGPLYFSLATNAPSHNLHMPHHEPASMVRTQSSMSVAPERTPATAATATPERKTPDIPGVDFFGAGEQAMKLNKGGKSQYSRTQDATSRRRHAVKLAAYQQRAIPGLVVDPNTFNTVN